MNTLGLTLLFLFAGAIIFLPRPWAVLGYLCGIGYLTQGQSIEIANFNFTAIRLLLMAGLIRVLARGEHHDLTINAVDKSLFLFTTLSTIAYISSRGTSGAAVFQLGICYNILISYFVFRCLFRNTQDLLNVVTPLAFLIVPLMILMVRESITGQNCFTAFGGLPESPVLREGSFRAQGPFRSAITAGTLGATLMPLFATHYILAPHRLISVIGFIAATGITVASGSSGPLLAYVAGVIALLFWPFRRYLRIFQWSLLIALVLLHLFMKAPVWYVIARIGGIMGGNGWHRAFIIDQAVTHFDAWWWVGTDNTGGWVPYQLLIDGSADITNQFLAAGVRTGFLSMLLLIGVIVWCFKSLGQTMKEAGIQNQPDERILWGLGCTLVVTVVNFISVAYFDQIEEIFYLQLACISSLSFSVLENAKEEKYAPVKITMDTPAGPVNSFNIYS